ncbi:hypothetical protein LCGC14_0513400 [marine sediment metagenome]|uniref:Ketopantoate reductase N-terminal domain-containing protein n=1 Tax=marine sediment metagenome TaxID=412755 RepID=A0A0F9S0L8_9ZZZZ
MKVKIFGAGSIGNHLAQAARTMDWEVLICDSDRKVKYSPKTGQRNKVHDGL